MQTPSGVSVTGTTGPRFDEVLTEQALGLVARLHRELDARRLQLLAARTTTIERISAGGTLGFLAETAAVRQDDSWQVAPPAPGLVDRRVEITGPTDRKMTINALNSGAKVWLADQEDANTPLWVNVIGGQLSLKDAITRSIDFTADNGKRYQLCPVQDQPTIVVRPRGLHLPEKHLLVDGERTSGAFVDFALYFAGCAQLQVDRGQGPYFYLPKLESHLEARLWNDAFVIAQDLFGMAQGTIRATVLVETLPAAFEMEEILYELREHSAGLNAGRWDYMFSAIKTFRSRGTDFMLPDRNSVTMTVPFMRAYTELLVRTCHQRGAHAIGGMSAFVPSRDPEVNATAFAKVQADKSREAGDGFDGSWVAHPGMVGTCRDAFDAVLGERPHQLDRLRADVDVSADQLLDIAATPGQVTEAGLRSNVSVALQYLAVWLKGTGAVAIFGLMEDAATAEISRSQVWQWLHHGVTLDTGRVVTRELVEQVVGEEVAALGGDPADYDDARAVFLEVAVADTFADFLTLPAYERMP